MGRNCRFWVSRGYPLVILAVELERDVEDFSAGEPAFDVAALGAVVDAVEAGEEELEVHLLGVVEGGW